MLEIISNLCVDLPVYLAVAGAGGKTTLMKYLAESLPGKVVCTTTTKLSFEESKLFQDHLRVESSHHDFNFLDQWPGKNLLITQEPSVKDSGIKLEGLSLSQITSLKKACLNSKMNLIIEADGAKRKYLKAPEKWEPVVPQDINLFVYVVNLGAIGKALSDENVFRSEIFAHLSSSQPGDEITIEMVTRYLKHPLGGQKGIPKDARKLLVLNSLVPFSEIPWLIEHLQTLFPYYDAFFLGKLDQGSPVYQRIS